VNVIVNANRWITAMAKLFNAIKNLTVAPQPMDDNALRRRVRELEAENQELREKLVWRGPWMF
jgi:type VI protein secretion system component VasF